MESTSDNIVDEKGDTTAGKPRKHRVVIHSSPFLRCIQTGVAISAGINQAKRAPSTQPLSRSNSGTAAANRSRRHSPSPLSPLNDSTQLETIQEPQKFDDAASKEKANQQNFKILKPCILRLDAFLGEWMTPDYYESITPPPGSIMMLASAKAELLRPAEKIDSHSLMGSRQSSGHFPGGWMGMSAGNITESPVNPPLDENIPIGNLSLGRSECGDDGNGNGRRLPRLSTNIAPNEKDVYVPPTPTYAISPSDPIPAGYVAHARDACVEIDYQWDSMRSPLDWGTGGEYGEEWSSMHERLQTGLERMVSWYQLHGIQEPRRRPSVAGQSWPVANDSEEDDGVDTVLILVTHGAGCNALIGALTNRPALMDVGMASLTVAARKQPVIPDEDPETSPKSKPRRLPPKGLSDEYDIEILASSDHLRTGSPFSNARSRSPRILPNSILSHRQRFGSVSGDFGHTGFTLGESTLNNPAAGQDRGRVSHTVSRSLSVNKTSSGLWGSSSLADTEEDMLPNFEDPKPVDSRTPYSQEKSATLAKEADKNSQLSRTPSQHKLWGSKFTSQSPDRERDREHHSKRRWTVVERSTQR